MFTQVHNSVCVGSPVLRVGEMGRYSSNDPLPSLQCAAVLLISSVIGLYCLHSFDMSN